MLESAHIGIQFVDPHKGANVEQEQAKQTEIIGTKMDG